MSKCQFSGWLFLGLVAGCSTPSHEGHQTTLFNGRNLQGWVAMGGGEWTVEQGVLVGRHGTDWTTNPEVAGSWLRSEKEYGDFTLELEYAINDGGNSGIFIRSALNKNPAYTGHEVQVLPDHGRPPTNHSTGSLYDVVAPMKNMSRPAGEWNQVRIVARGANIQVTLNGEKILNYEPSRSLRGYLGLQVHDERSVIKFRNIRVTEQ